METKTAIRAGLLLVAVAVLVFAATFLANADESDKATVALEWLPQTQLSSPIAMSDPG